MKEKKIWCKEKFNENILQKTGNKQQENNQDQK